ncbi:hypothetical protein HN371_08155 [Candidatus Poribacteria bacterium]|jgi:hypothetical protein|nr:hypothetical protein [Candidatus Poribacteria bacterium]MBT5537043.1 hypothetical protein [Candidatus Poribacteria bacterium]MBT7100949.1 hypothetical protein [Candidatus Poribacteria bacterium]MBT7809008.1 hypothetical protein [Candidatus Poribacteria bacterium]
MSGRTLFAALLGALLGVGVAVGGSAIADGAGPPDDPAVVRYVMVTSFQPESAWTEEYAAAGVRKLSEDYTRDAIEGFQAKTFVGNFDRNEFGGVYRFADADALEAFLAKHPPAENRVVKTFRVLGEWQAAGYDGP